MNAIKDEATEVAQASVAAIIADGIEFQHMELRLQAWLSAKEGINFGQHKNSRRWHVMRYGIQAKRDFDSFAEMLVAILGAYFESDWSELWD